MMLSAMTVPTTAMMMPITICDIQFFTTIALRPSRLLECLLGETFDDIRAEFRILVADLSRLFVIGCFAPSLGSFQALKHVDRNARFLGGLPQ
jgi:hypothetical protein